MFKNIIIIPIFILLFSCGDNETGGNNSKKIEPEEENTINPLQPKVTLDKKEEENNQKNLEIKLKKQKEEIEEIKEIKQKSEELKKDNQATQKKKEEIQIEEDNLENSNDTVKKKELTEKLKKKKAEVEEEEKRNKAKEDKLNQQKQKLKKEEEKEIEDLKKLTKEIKDAKAKFKKGKQKKNIKINEDNQSPSIDPTDYTKKENYGNKKSIKEWQGKGYATTAFTKDWLNWVLDPNQFPRVVSLLVDFIQNVVDQHSTLTTSDYGDSKKGPAIGGWAALFHYKNKLSTPQKVFDYLNATNDASQEKDKIKTLGEIPKEFNALKEGIHLLAKTVQNLPDPKQVSLVNWERMHGDIKQTLLDICDTLKLLDMTNVKIGTGNRKRRESDQQVHEKAKKKIKAAKQAADKRKRDEAKRKDVEKKINNKEIIRKRKRDEYIKQVNDTRSLLRKLHEDTIKYAEDFEKIMKRDNQELKTLYSNFTDEATYERKIKLATMRPRGAALKKVYSLNSLKKYHQSKDKLDKIDKEFSVKKNDQVELDKIKKADQVHAEIIMVYRYCERMIEAIADGKWENIIHDTHKKELRS